MYQYIALLRAVNVGGTGKLAMGELKSMCEELGFAQVKTYIASGNVLFKCPHTAEKTCALLEQRLATYASKPVGVFIRTPSELDAILERNPFHKEAPNRTVAIFLNAPPTEEMISLAKGRTIEKIALGTSEIYVHYGDGMASTKLVIPSAKSGTARNINTLRKLLELSKPS
jgi:uncharacterized protein (DUF1697 family)